MTVSFLAAGLAGRPDGSREGSVENANHVSVLMGVYKTSLNFLTGNSLHNAVRHVEVSHRAAASASIIIYEEVNPGQRKT